MVDVGGTYEPEKQRFDHHQKTFTETYSEAGIEWHRCMHIVCITHTYYA